IRAIKCLRCSEEFSTTHFGAVEKINDLGIFDKKQIYYRMDFSGFVMLVMGFNGAKADAVKEAYINAFNWMSAELRKYSESYEAERNAVMLEYMKEKDVASMSGRLLNRWGRVGDWGKYRRILFLAYEHWLLTEELRFRWGALLLQYVLSF
ncbi:hypothetical protein BAE75_001179, partial [Escherichia coli]|nr:hypothetical protein [Escherichia coli]EFM6986709.1 hypothetical protein [Escherichia coli]